MKDPKNNQQAEDTISNHHHDNPAPLVPSLKLGTKSCMFSSLTFQASVLFGLSLSLWAPLPPVPSTFAAQSSRTPPRYTCSANIVTRYRPMRNYLRQFLDDESDLRDYVKNYETILEDE